jgi:putative mRNA 3-end processing factor
MIGFLYEDNCLRVEGLPLWLDVATWREGRAARRPLVFVSHAHADHIGRHRRVICTPPTLALMRARQKVEEVTVLEYGEPFEIAGARISLHPAGHVLGSAMILIEYRDHRLCYTGDYRLGAGLTTETCAPVPCDILLTECTYGHPKYRFPPREELLERLHAFVEETFDRCAFPVVLGYSLGKAQEAVKALETLGYGVVAHPTVIELCRIYERFGVPFPTLDALNPRTVGRRVVVCPPMRGWQEYVAQVGPTRAAILTGWAIDGRAGGFAGADIAIPFSDHCDFDQLVEFVQQSGATRILTHHGDAERFADHLCARGFDAEALVPGPQAKLF